MHEGEAKDSQLIIYPDGTLYHIDLKHDDNIPQNILFMGSAGRVDLVATHFDEITFEHHNAARPEFYIKSGTYKGVPVAAFSTGIGVDNIEIVLTELHALFEYNHETDTWTDVVPKVNIIRLGSCGSSHPSIPAGSLAISSYSLGLDNLSAYYPPTNQTTTAKNIEKAFLKTSIGKLNPLTYCSAADPDAVSALEDAANAAGEDEKSVFTGITTSSPGFFAPEGRSIGRISTKLSYEEFQQSVRDFSAEGMDIIDHEMETSILFRIGHEILGYKVSALCLVVDNLNTDDVLTSDVAENRMHDAAGIALEALVSL